VGCPERGSVQQPTAIHLHRPAPGRGQVGARVRLTHANTKKGFAPADRRNMALLLRLCTVAQDQRPALTVSSPVSQHWRPESEQLFNQHITREGVFTLPTVFCRPCHTYPSAFSELSREPGIEPHPRFHSAGCWVIAQRFL